MIPEHLQWVYSLGNVFIFVGMGIYWTFCVAYTYLAKWWRHESGAHLFTFSLAMALILSYVAGRVIFPTYVVEPVDLYARTAIFGIEAGLATWRLSILIRSQLRAYRVEVGRDRNGNDGNDGHLDGRGRRARHSRRG